MKFQAHGRCSFAVQFLFSNFQKCRDFSQISGTRLAILISAIFILRKGTLMFNYPEEFQVPYIEFTIYFYNVRANKSLNFSPKIKLFLFTIEIFPNKTNRPYGTLKKYIYKIHFWMKNHLPVFFFFSKISTRSAHVR